MTRNLPAHVRSTHHKPTAHQARAHAAAPTDDTLPGFVEQFQRFSPIAQKIPAAEVRSARIDVSLVLLNASRGVAALLARREQVAALPGISIAQIESLAAIGQALQYAAGRVERYQPVTGEIQAMLATARRVRTSLIAKAEVLAIDGVVPAATIAGIRRGRGAIDTAGDCVALAALFHAHAAALPGRVSVTAADIQDANDIGGKLLAVLRPDGAKKLAAQELVGATDARDRLWTLFQQTWEACVYRPGVWLFGLDAEAHVPMLGTRVGRRTAKPAAAPAATTPATT